MSFPDLRSFLSRLEEIGELARVKAEVDPDQEITVIQHRVLAARGPALLFENVKGSRHRVVSNLFGTPERVQLALGRAPAEIGADLGRLATELVPPTLSTLWKSRGMLGDVAKARLKTVSWGPVMDQVSEPADLTRLPCLKCWPEDGGHFFTLPLVHTVDPETGHGNLGIYRLQRYDAGSTGMHWQIEKGGGFHFSRAAAAGKPGTTACGTVPGKPLPVSVILGGPPALTLAAIAPLPEGVDERLFAAYLQGKPLRVLKRAATGHRVPASAEFVLEGTVTPGDIRKEGPFGDHLGHYSHSADFPVYRVDRVLARRDAIYPATVVGKPPQEDYFIGEALQDMTLPLLKAIKPGIADLWAYPETGFHPLAVAAVRQRYSRESLKHAMSILGEGQLSLTKVLMVVDADVKVRDFRAVSRAVRQNLDPVNGLRVIADTAQDTLDFTGPSMNSGSRLLILATRDGDKPARETPPPPPPKPSVLHPNVTAVRALGEAFLMVQVTDNADRGAIQEALNHDSAASQYLFHVLVSDDVPVDNDRLSLWGWFTRFDPFSDVHPRSRNVDGNRLILEPPFLIDATWKPGYRDPVAFDPDIADRVNANWDRYGIDTEDA